MKKTYWIDWLRGEWGYYKRKVGTVVIGYIKSTILGEKLIENNKKKWYEFWKSP